MISSSSELAGSPRLARMSETRRGSSMSTSEDAERFTATARSRPASRQALTWSSDWASTATVRSRISPDCSARGRNESGKSRPRVGWFQRTSASTPPTRRERESTFGW